MNWLRPLLLLNVFSKLDLANKKEDGSFLLAIISQNNAIESKNLIVPLMRNRKHKDINNVKRYK